VGDSPDEVVDHTDQGLAEARNRAREARNRLSEEVRDTDSEAVALRSDDETNHTPAAKAAEDVRVRIRAREAGHIPKVMGHSRGEWEARIHTERSIPGLALLPLAISTLSSGPDPLHEECAQHEDDQRFDASLGDWAHRD